MSRTRLHPIDDGITLHFHTRTPYAGASQRYDRMPAKLRQAVIERDRRCVLVREYPVPGGRPRRAGQPRWHAHQVEPSNLVPGLQPSPHGTGVRMEGPDPGGRGIGADVTYTVLSSQAPLAVCTGLGFLGVRWSILDYPETIGPWIARSATSRSRRQPVPDAQASIADRLPT